MMIGELPCANGMGTLLQMRARLILDTLRMHANANPTSMHYPCQRRLLSMIQRYPHALKLIFQSKAPIQNLPYYAD